MKLMYWHNQKIEAKMKKIEKKWQQEFMFVFISICFPKLEDRLKISNKTNICIYYKLVTYPKELKNAELSKMSCNV